MQRYIVDSENVVVNQFEILVNSFTLRILRSVSLELVEYGLK
jgi:hypothetical protein